MEILQNIAIAIDNLRISKGMTIRELCLDICDESTYRRYKLGDRDIPIARIKQFCDKLGIGLDEFLYNLASKNSYEHRKIHRLFYDLQARNYDQIKKLLPQIDVDEISLDNNKI
ncbi:MAG: helix-turn-helix transcriptional regulator, partial [Acholeplasmataceae bacterium]|nr:helix-turn-helix transcriptional regulator [Acholeplasmataceae bacterium]